jgi:hypothetical protein
MTTSAKKTPTTRKAPVQKTPAVTTDLSEVLNFETVVEDGGTPNAPAVDDDTESEEQTESHENGVSEVELLRAQLAAAQEQLASAPKASIEKPKPESELTPEQRQVRELQDQLARERGKKDSYITEYTENVVGGILVHFLDDGLTGNNRVFYRGQEYTFGPEAYADTVDRLGFSWLNLDDDEQIARWGKVRFRKGPWPFQRKYEEAALANTSITASAPVTSL